MQVWTVVSKALALPDPIKVLLDAAEAARSGKPVSVILLDE
jgi:hypothetical protein